ncbi:MAG: 4Fe-4S dicluster domain-containing protein [Chloroflexi bacterium]|nr:4Fe-4S dicluster domain-containing protein [Chloroflexota bacterium]MBU1746927.1 4Fe-4S dicluster domain-containing protein [Chloroflexota bacterium]
MTRWGMVIDLDKCTGCQACSMACRMENNIPFAGPEQADLSRVKWWHKVLRLEEGEYPRVRITLVPRPCQHCDNPPCVRVCPVGATYRDEEGLVRMDYDRCIGCRFCTTACPYTVRHFNWYEPVFPEEMQSYLNPDVPVRPRGVVEKCTFCVHRLEKAKRQAAEQGRDLRDAELVLLPACNQTCPASARYFGDLDDPESTVSHLAHSKRAFTLLEDLGTRPKVIYLKEGQ